LVFKKGKTHMNGETALKYARSRHSLEDGSDFSRARRQHLLLEAVKDKILSLNLITKIPPLLDQLGDHFKTDFPLSQIPKFSKEIVYAEKYQFFTYVLSTKNYLDESISDDGQYILIPKAGENNFEEIQKAIKIIFQGIDPQKTPTPTTTPKITKKYLKNNT
jgi:anionic cell wall polymer biosynthesis LytR-Cps2A-Psr (LCP) family protein